MQKNMIALFLSIVLVTGSVGAIPVLASEAIAEDAVNVPEEVVVDDVPEESEETDYGLTAEPAFADEIISTEEGSLIPDIIDTASAEENVSTEEENTSQDIIEAADENNGEDDQIELRNAAASEEALNIQEETVEISDVEEIPPEITDEASEAEMIEIIDSDGVVEEKSSEASNAIIGLSSVDEIWQAERIETDVTVASEGCVLAGLPGKYITDVNAALDAINKIRKEACEEGVPDPRTGQPLTIKDYKPIKWSNDLEYVARIRAAESALTGGHYRTSGESIWNLAGPNGFGSFGEVLAWNWSESVTTGIDQWYGEKKDWVDQNTEAVTGHYTSMINPDNLYVGLGTFCSDEVSYYNTTAGEFSFYTAPDESHMQMSGNCVQMLELLTEGLYGYQIVGTLPGATGDTQRLMLAANTRYSFGYGLVYFFDGVKWSSSDTSVATVTKDGVVKAVGSGSVTIKATAANGTISAEVQCVIKGLESWTVKLSQSEYTYDGTEKKPDVSVAFDGNTLTEGTDYSVTYVNNVHAGTASVRITGIGVYSGQLVKTFTIAKAQQNLTATPTSSSLAVGATAGISVDGLGTIHYSSSDSSIVTVSNNGELKGINEGTATITVTASGDSDYLDDETSFVITVYHPAASIPIEDCEVSITQTGYIYTGNEVEPELTIRYDGKDLKKGTDYSVTYENNINAGTATATIYGMRNYTGSVKKTFTIAKAQQNLTAIPAVSSLGIGLTTNIIVNGFGTISYSSDNISVVTVSKDGILEGIAEGTATISVVASGDSNHLGAETSFKMTVTSAYDVAWQTCGEDAIWTYYSDGTVRITGTGTVELIRNSDGSYLWDYFYSSAYPKVHTVIVEEGITEIGSDFFAVKRPPGIGKMSDSPEMIILADSVKTIGLRAFYNCSNLETIVFGSGVSSLDQFVFSFCPSLKKIVVSEDNETYKSVDGVLLSKDGTVLYKLPGYGVTDYTIPDGVTTLGLDCMADLTSLKTVSIPNTVHTIKSYAFDGSDNITDVYFGGSNADWRAVSIGGYNDVLSKATIHCAIAYTQIRNCEVSVNSSDCVYNGSAWKPDTTVTFKGMKLTEGTDYTITYKDNINAGTAKVILTGKGDFSGTKTATFTISKAVQPITVKSTVLTVIAGKSIDVSVTGAKGELSCEIRDPSMATATVSGTTITTISTKTGFTKLIIKAKETANYISGEKELELRIVPGKTTRGDMFNLANNVKVTWKEVPGAKYYKVYREGITDSSESVVEPVITTSELIGWDKEPGLTNGHSYRYRIVASLTGKGDSRGDSLLSYSKEMYRLKTVVIRSAKNTAPGKVTVKYDKTSSGDSYVLQYSVNKDMTNATTKVILGANNTTCVLGGFKKGKTYYISIRVRKKVNGIDYYTTFGVPKEVKITQ